MRIVIDDNCLNRQGGTGGASYDDTAILKRLQKLEARTDNFVKDVTVSREGNKVKFTYTRVDGTSSEVEFDDKDTITAVYDDTALKARVTALEDKPDNDKQTLALEGNTLTISNGNSVTLPNSASQELKSKLTYTKSVTYLGKECKKFFVSSDILIGESNIIFLQYKDGQNLDNKQSSVLINLALTGIYKVDDATIEWEGSDTLPITLSKKVNSLKVIVVSVGDVLLDLLESTPTIEGDVDYTP